MTGGASGPHPSSSTLEVVAGFGRRAGAGAMPPDLVGVKTGLLATGGRGALDVEAEAMGACDSAEYLEPDESATL